MKLLCYTLLFFGIILLILSAMMGVLRQQPSGAYWVLFDNYANVSPDFSGYSLLRAHPDGSNARQVVSRRFNVFSAEWSPSRDWILLQSLPAAEYSLFYKIYPYTHTVQPFTALPEWGSQPAISPNGETIVYVEERGADSDLFLVDANGESARQSTHSLLRKDDPQWSPDGEWIFFVETVGSQSSIFRIRPDGTDLQRITQFGTYISSLRVSPDNEWITFLSRYRIYRMRLDGSEPQHVTNDDTRLNSIALSPDGAWIVADGVAATDSNSDTDIFLMRLDGSGFQRLRLNTTRDTQPVWSPNGEWIIFISGSRGLNPEIGLYRIRPNGTQLQKLADTDIPNHTPAVSPLIDLPINTNNLLILSIFSLCLLLVSIVFGSKYL